MTTPFILSHHQHSSTNVFFQFRFFIRVLKAAAPSVPSVIFPHHNPVIEVGAKTSPNISSERRWTGIALSSTPSLLHQTVLSDLGVVSSGISVNIK